MATLKTNLIEPEGATTTLTVGEAGGDLVIGADSLKANTGKSRTDSVTTSFTSTGANTWTCPTGVTSAEVLIVGGGGSGGSNGGGGAGGGGIVHATAYTVVPAVVYDITVGVGQARTTGTAVGVNGGDSVWNVNAEGSGIAMTAKGGGGGGSNVAGEHPGNAGGSGGGANWQGPGSPGVGASNQADFAGATSYGNDSGQAFEQGSPANWYSAGGGGASAAGSIAAAGTSGHGGGGKAFSISGDADYLGAGGGGGTYGSPWTAGDGGAGGGGAGSNTGQAGDGWSYGSGGGGGGTTNGGGGSGMQGVVYIKYDVATPQTLFSSNGSGVVSSVNAGWGGVQRLISSQTVSNQASISFTTGIDSTYKEYIFEFFNMQPATDGVDLLFQGSDDGGSNYDTIITSTFFEAYHGEADNGAALIYLASNDQALGTAYQSLTQTTGSESDQSCSGELHLFNPASTTFIKNFYSRINESDSANFTVDCYAGGYFNISAAINAVSFKFDSGNINAGKIKMYGIK